MIDHGENVPILMYHHLTTGAPAPGRYEISVAQFAAQLDCLQRRGFRTLTVSGLLQTLGDGRSLPRKTVVITFDDAYRSFKELAMPALQARGMTATVYVPVGHVGGRNVWDRARGFPERELMSAAEIKTLAASDVEIGVHGWEHLDLTRCTESQLERETAGARAEAARLTGVAVTSFSYPYGRHSQAHFELLREAGYAGAVSIFSSEPSVTANPLAMRRVYIHEGDTLFRFRLKLNPLYLRWRGWRRY